MDYSLKLMALNKEGCLVSGITHTRMKCIKMSQNFKCIRKTKLKLQRVQYRKQLSAFNLSTLLQYMKSLHV